MNNYIPKMYKRSIYDIDYKKLKDNNIKYLLFDLDNTLLEIGKDLPDKNVCDLIRNLKKDFQVIIVSNNNSEKRIKAVSDYLDISYIKFALKPFQKGFNAVKNKYDIDKKEMCIIGDQIMTDILGGNKYGIYTVLIDPISEEELKITGINRFFENKVLKKLDNKKLFKRGNYYE